MLMVPVPAKLRPPLRVSWPLVPSPAVMAPLPVATLTLPPTVPVPLRVAPLATVTLEPAASVPLTCRVPALTAVVPV